jgi:ATP-binding cassette subfamily B (MDR/TAP) protein 10
MLAGYVLEPVLTKVYMENVMMVGEKVLAALRLELFRTLLMQRIQFYDNHNATELTALISVDLDTMRSFVFKWVPGGRRGSSSNSRAQRCVMAPVLQCCMLWH